MPCMAPKCLRRYNRLYYVRRIGFTDVHHVSMPYTAFFDDYGMKCVFKTYLTLGLNFGVAPLTDIVSLEVGIIP